MVDADIAVEAISALVGEDIQPKVNEVSSNIKAIYDTLGIMQEAIQAFNDIPFMDLEVPDGEELDRAISVAAELASTLDPSAYVRTVRAIRGPVLDLMAEQIAGDRAGGVSPL